MTTIFVLTFRHSSRLGTEPARGCAGRFVFFQQEGYSFV